jgi:hypothetical protein
MTSRTAACFVAELRARGVQPPNTVLSAFEEPVPRDGLRPLPRKC